MTKKRETKVSPKSHHPQERRGQLAASSLARFGKVGPALTRPDHGYQCDTDAIVGSHFLKSVTSTLLDSGYLVFSQFYSSDCISRLEADVSSFCKLVCVILCNSSKLEVLRIDARRIVAFVHYN